MPVQHTIWTGFEEVLQLFREFVKPFAGILLVEPKYQTIPICDFDSFLSLFDSTSFLVGRDAGFCIFNDFVILVIVVASSRAEKVAAHGDLLEFLEPLCELFIDIGHGVGKAWEAA